MKTKTNDGKPVKMWANSGKTYAQHISNKECSCPVLVIPLTAESIRDLYTKIFNAIEDGPSANWLAAERVTMAISGAVSARSALGITPRKRVLRPSANKGGK